MLGCWILTTTASPLFSLARCACPIEAEAKGDLEKSSNISDTERESSVSIVLLTVENVSLGTLSCNVLNV